MIGPEDAAKPEAGDTGASTAMPGAESARGSDFGTEYAGRASGAGGSCVRPAGFGVYAAKKQVIPAAAPPAARKRRPLLFWGMLVVIIGLAVSHLPSFADKNPFQKKRLAIVNIEGVIMDSSAVVQWADTVRHDPKYVGALVYINSPGGAVGPSQEIYEAVRRLAKEKPTVVSMGAVAASGGYYAALGADTIYANPSTLTASIGVKLQLPNFQGLMHTIGISEKTLTTGALKDAGSSFRDMTPEEEKYLRGLIGDMYDQFIETVAERRNMPLEAVKPHADGRAMTGRQAKAAGLVDYLGTRHDAVLALKEKCGLPNTELVRADEGPVAPQSFLRDLLQSALDLQMEQRTRMEQPIFMY